MPAAELYVGPLPMLPRLWPLGPFELPAFRVRSAHPPHSLRRARRGRFGPQASSDSKVESK